MRLPNGYGSVYKLKGPRRKPWVARKTVGSNEKGHPEYYYVGYFETRADAMDALALFNHAPNAQKATFKEVYELWWEDASPKLKTAVKATYVSVKERLNPLMKMRMQSIKLSDMEALTKKETKAVGNNIRVVLGHVFDYAVHHELITADRRELVRHVQLSDREGTKVQRRVFSTEEMAKITEPELTILLYTGLRVGELIALEADDIHLNERFFQVKKSKTEAGVRVVPIAEKIVPLFACLPTQYDYYAIKKMAQKYGHLPHDTRHTFISRMADLGIDERVTKAIVGHAGSGITETVYTHIDLSVLKNAVNKL